MTKSTGVVSSATRYSVVWALVAALCSAAPSLAQPQSSGPPLRFEISVPAAAHSEPVTGRV